MKAIASTRPGTRTALLAAATLLALVPAAGAAGARAVGAGGQAHPSGTARAAASDVQRFDALLGRGPLLVFAFHPL